MIQNLSIYQLVKKYVDMVYEQKMTGTDEALTYDEFS